MVLNLSAFDTKKPRPKLAQSSSLNLDAFKKPGTEPLQAPKETAKAPINFDALRMDQTFGDKSIADVAAPASAPVDFSKITGVFKEPSRTFLPNTEATAGKSSIMQKVVSALPENTRGGVESFTNDLQQGLFGTPQSREIMQRKLESGEPVDIYDSLVNEGLPFGVFIGRSKGDMVEHRAGELEKSGTPADRAAAIAFYDVFQGNDPLDKNATTAKQRLQELQVTPEEQRVLTLAHVGQFAGNIGDVLNVTPVGFISKAARPNLIRSLVRTSTAEGAAEILRAAKVPDDLITTYAPMFAKTKDKAEIERGIDSLTRIIETTRPELTAAKETSGKKVSPPKTPERAADDYWRDVIEPNRTSGKTVEISGDEMKKHFGADYAPERSDLYSKAAYRNLTKLMEDKNLKTVSILAGGPGAGKSELLGTMIKDNNAADILYDTSFTSKEGIKKILDLAKANGKEVNVSGILTDLETARYHTVKRGAETGRNVTDEVFANRHAAFPRVLQDLLESGDLKPNEIHLYDFRNAKTPAEAKAMVENGTFVKNPLETLRNVMYNEEDILSKYGADRFQQASKEGALRKESGGKGRDVPAGKQSLQEFEGFEDLTTTLLDDLKGRTTVSKQYLLDATNRPELKQAEREIFRQLLEDEPATVNVKEFAEKIKAELLPLKRISKEAGEDYSGPGGGYENTTLPADIRGPVYNYSEHVYESPIKTSAGNVHSGLPQSDSYFAHSRVEDMPLGEAPVNGKDISGNPIYDIPNEEGTLRRVIEIQSDLFQKGRLESEGQQAREILKNPTYKPENELNFKTPGAREAIVNEAQKRANEVTKLEPYRNTWHERVIREEVKQAAKDGKTKLQFPTGETAMKIEGLGDTTQWIDPRSTVSYRIKPEDLKIGEPVKQGHAGHTWIITDVLGNGKFKAVTKHNYDITKSRWEHLEGEEWTKHLDAFNESFDISGKVDFENPIYKFYEKTVGKYLQKKYGAKLITDAQGVKWWQIDVPASAAKAPVHAFGAGAGFSTDENGDITYDPIAGTIGLVGMTAAHNPKIRELLMREKDINKLRAVLKTHFTNLTETTRQRFAEMLSSMRSEKGAEKLIEQIGKLDESLASVNKGALDAEKAAIDEEKAALQFLKEGVQESPGKDLIKYQSSQRPGELPEILGKTAQEIKDKGLRPSKFNQIGDQIITQMGFEDQHQAQEALDRYIKARDSLKAQREAVKSRVKAYRDRKAVFDEVVKYVNQEGRARRDKIAAVQEFFQLEDADMKALLKNERDVRLMTDEEFNSFMKRLEGKATEAHFKRDAMIELQSTIFEKELEKVDNLRKALKLPEIRNMSIGQLKKFNEALQPFKQGDEFLGVRQLETVKHTDLAGIKTRREALERLAAQVNKERVLSGKAPVTVDDLNKIHVSELDRYRYDTALARQNPLYEIMVQEKNRAFLESDAQLMNDQERVDDLFKGARQSRSNTLLNRLIPSDHLVFRWLEANDADKLKIAEDMTEKELEAGMYIQASYREMRDYLLQRQVLKKYISDYVTHIRRGFLEAWKEEGTYVAGEISGEKPGAIRRAGRGLVAAFKEVFQKYMQDEAYFNILDQSTDQILPLEKFFQYSMKRSGELVPSKNVAKAFLQYRSTFLKKQALDSIIPKLDIYVHSLTPKKMTPRGLEFDRSLKNFFKEWMNSKKGRATDRALIKPGGKLDWALRTGVAFTRILDLGLSIPVGIASNLGAQAAVYRGIGTKRFLSGEARMFTKQGQKILKKYRNFTGEPVARKVFSSEGTLGDSIVSSVFGLFSFADRKARQAYLLGKMTPEEFAAGEITTERLARLQTDLGRNLPIPGSESIIGKTALGKVGTQYKTWAVPLLSSTLDDISKATKAIVKGDPEFLKSPEFGELLRTIVLSTVVGTATYGIVTDKTPQKDKPFTEKIASKAAQDALSLIGALDPSFWSSPTRLQSFLFDLADSIKKIVTIDTKQDGTMTGPAKLQRTMMPAAVRQLMTPFTGSSKGSGIQTPKITIPKLKVSTPKIKIPSIQI